MPEDKAPTTIRPPQQTLDQIEYLKRRLGITSMAAVLWFCVTRVYFEEKERERKS